ncbi:hypothetical protein A7P55_03010 [Acinetobacter sp. Ac_5812]|nr:hypothetical protein [Acinetobacter sp. Ac_5812]
MVYKKRLVSSFNKLSGKSKEGARKFYIRNELFFLLMMCLGGVNIGYFSLLMYFIYFVFAKMVDFYILLIFSFIFSFVIILILLLLRFLLELFFI